jgi:hypothetical protein
MNGAMNDSYSGAAYQEIARTQYEIVCNEKEYHDLRCSPHVIMRPTITRDGNAWLCIYGDLPSGVVGCGATPELACADFDRVWKGGDPDGE